MGENKRKKEKNKKEGRKKKMIFVTAFIGLALIGVAFGCVAMYGSMD